MSICGILGDSIALGLALAHPGCDQAVKVGRATQQIATHHLPEKHYQWVVISAGSNDYATPGLRRRLEAVRATVDADKVVWIEPLVSNSAASTVRDVAASHGDATQNYTVSGDHVHPKNYKGLWTSILAKLGF